MFRIFTITAFCCLSWSAFCQRVVIDNVTLQDEDIQLTFSLFAKSSQKEQYNIEVVSSRDNYSQALIIKSGAVTDVSPGSGKTIVIDGPSNFDGYSGELDFQIRARMTFIPLSFAGPNKVSGKRGKTITSNWDGLISSQTYSLQLLQNGVMQSTINSNVNQVSPTWSIPGDHDVGGGYQLKLISNSDRSISATSSEFSIKRKVPTFVKILPVAGVGAAVYLFLLQSSDSNLPGPPDLPSSNQN